MGTAPCKDCPDRYPGCHSKCEKYQAFYRENEKRLEENRQRQIQRADFWTARRKGSKKKGIPSR